MTMDILKLRETRPFHAHGTVARPRRRTWQSVRGLSGKRVRGFYSPAGDFQSRMGQLYDVVLVCVWRNGSTLLTGTLTTMTMDAELNT